jgi:hypothetical protein
LGVKARAYRWEEKASFRNARMARKQSDKPKNGPLGDGNDYAALAREIGALGVVVCVAMGAYSHAVANGADAVPALAAMIFCVGAFIYGSRRR